MIIIAEPLAKELVTRFGTSLQLHSDQGCNFESSVFQKIYVVLGIRKTWASALRSETHFESCLGLSMKPGSVSTSASIRLPFGCARKLPVSFASVLFGRKLRLLSDLKFDCKLEEHVARKDYVSNLRKKWTKIMIRCVQDANNRNERTISNNGWSRRIPPVALFNPWRRRS